MFLHELKSFPIEKESIKGFGKSFFSALKKLGIETVYDAITFFPKKYQDRTYIQSLQEVAGKVLQNSLEGVTAFTVLEVLKHDFVYIKDTQTLKIVFVDAIKGYPTASYILFNRTKPVLINMYRKKFKEGKRFFVYATFNYKYDSLQITNLIEIEEVPENIRKEDLPYVLPKEILPVYKLTGNLKQKQLRTFLKYILDKYTADIEDYLPLYLIKKRNFLPLKEAIYQLHFPKSMESLESARISFVYTEFFNTEITVAYAKSQAQAEKRTRNYKPESNLAESFLRSLPFKLTNAQKKAIEDIRKDLLSGSIMHRLIQGDVGSGKTIVAIYAMLMAVESGYQTAMMVPTDILAMQHYKNITKLLKDFGLEIRLLRGDMPNYEKSIVKMDIETGRAQIVIGTHALFQEDVTFKNLGLVVIDEQHRFGVSQRIRFRQKGLNPDTLVMTATPIPRSLAMTLYGNLDITVIDELPEGRQKIITKWVRKRDIKKVYEFIKSELDKGFQAFFVYPIITESEKLMEVASAERMYELLKNRVFNGYKIGLLHGRLPTQEKMEVMEKFAQGEIQILVTTSVVEVGIDVPKATVMVIENAERFGLAQLHQLRGRVGRSIYQSYCFLISSNNITEDAVRRLQAMEQYNDGFKIAEMDLEIRGPGELLGTKQSGIPDFKLADLIKDIKILETARKDAFKIIELDPELSKPQNILIKSIIDEYKKEFAFSG